MTMPGRAAYANSTKDVIFDSGNASRHITSVLLTHPLSDVYRERKSFEGIRMCEWKILHPLESWLYLLDYACSTSLQYNKHIFNS